MSESIQRLTLMESKILELGKRQSDKGYQRGGFSPGFIRKETEYGYRAINTALENLIGLELVEKTVTSSFRNGSVVELDVYKITEQGKEVLDRIEAGEITVDGKEPAPPPRPARVPPQRKYSKPWDSPQAGRHQAGADPDLARAVRTLEGAMQAMGEDLRALHEKLDRILEAGTGRSEPSPPEPASEPKPARKRKPRKMTREALDHRRMVLAAVVEAGKIHDFVLAEDVKSAYLEACKKAGLKPKGMSQFTTFLKRLEAEGLLHLKRSGCKALGIKGQGTRVVVSLTAEGEGLAGKN